MPPADFSEEDHSELFGKLDDIPFPSDALQRLLPQSFGRWELIGAAKSVPWQWVLACDASSVAVEYVATTILPLRF